MALKNLVVIDGWIQDFGIRVIGNDNSVGTGSISFGGGTKKDGTKVKSQYVKFEIWRPKPELSDALISAASKAKDQNHRKGTVIRLNGFLKEDTWVDKKSGDNRRLVKVVASDITINPPMEEMKSGTSKTSANKTTTKAAAASQPAAQKRPTPPPPPVEPEIEPVADDVEMPF